MIAHGIPVKFVKNGRDIGYAIGVNEGDHIGFEREHLKALVTMSQLQGSEMVILETKESFPVKSVKTLDEGYLAVRVVEALDSVAVALSELGSDVA